MYNIRRTFRKVYLLRKIYINEHTVDVGADSSRPTIIKKKHIQTPQNVAYKIFNKHTEKRVIYKSTVTSYLSETPCLQSS